MRLKKYVKAVVGCIVTVIVFIAKADISSASSLTLYQPKLPKENE
ncbi:cyclic lactone autoinducer peptide [Anaerobacillus sp. CMMVII]|nr:cyclic lactone autoinducer peptide [Anaerobacillus sp. CMMVII]MCT8139393.1 cyclic lactone autoinducer peptide [Anaerobacillus sp. CMMVII]